MNVLNQCEYSQSVGEKWVCAIKPNPNLYLLLTRIHVVATILSTKFQSQPCLTICYTIHQRLEGPSWYEMAESVCTRSVLV